MNMNEKYYKRFEKIMLNSKKLERPLVLKDALYENPKLIHNCEKEFNEIFDCLYEKNFLWKLGSLPKLLERTRGRVRLQILVNNLTQKRKRMEAMLIIQKYFLECYYNPKYILCRRRIYRQINNIIHNLE